MLKTERALFVVSMFESSVSSKQVTGSVVVDQYEMDDVHVTLIVPFGRQDGLSLGLRTRGTVTHETRDRDGHVEARTSEPFETTFVVRRATGGRWLNVAVLP